MRRKSQSSLKHLDQLVLVNPWDMMCSDPVKPCSVCACSGFHRSLCSEKTDSWGMCLGLLYLHKPSCRDREKEGEREKGRARPLVHLIVSKFIICKCIFYRVCVSGQYENPVFLLVGIHCGFNVVFSGADWRGVCACAVLLLGDITAPRLNLSTYTAWKPAGPCF